MKKRFVFPLLAAFFLSATAIKAQVSFTVPTTQKLVAPVEVSFTNTSKYKAESFAWDFGDGGTSTEANPTHRYTQSGNYTVVLNAKKGKKTKTTKQMIQVTAPERCLIEFETEFGTMTAELSNGTPKHRDNFIKLAEEGYYNDLLFHRVINGFMIQGGDPDSRNAAPGKALGMGGPSYQIPAEFVDSLVHTKVPSRQPARAILRRNHPGRSSTSCKAAPSPRPRSTRWKPCGTSTTRRSSALRTSPTVVRPSSTANTPCMAISLKALMLSTKSLLRKPHLVIVRRKT